MNTNDELYNKSLRSSSESRSSRGLYANADRLLGDSQAGDASLEGAEKFRAELSVYAIPSGAIRHRSRNDWDTGNGGVPLDWDADSRTVYLDSSDAHTLIIGATGSKKSRLAAMPMARILGAARESMVICDPKAEIYRRTAAVLKERYGYDVWSINLRNPSEGDSWNILSIPFRHFQDGNPDKAIEYVNDLTINLIPIQSSKDPYWDYTSRDLLFGLILLLFYLQRDKQLPESSVNISNVLRLKTELFQSTKTESIKRTPPWKFAEAYSDVKAKLLGTVICPSDTMSCVLSVFDQHMSCFSFQPKLSEMLSSNSFSVETLGFHPAALFLIMPDEKTSYHKIVTVIVKQIYEFLIDQAFHRCKDNYFPVRINFLMDEFSSLPAIPDFPQMITASRSRNIRFTLIVQSKHQLLERYGEETETIQSNCTNWLFLYSRETSLLKEISELGGEKSGRPLLPVSRLQLLDKAAGECLVFSGRKRPYFAHLPDIDQYDGASYDILPFAKREAAPAVKLPPACELFPVPAGRPEGNARPNIDEMIKQIDAKLAEFEKEEAEKKNTGASEAPSGNPNHA